MGSSDASKEGASCAIGSTMGLPHEVQKRIPRFTIVPQFSHLITRLGISVELLGAAIYFMGLFSGYMVAVLLTGYVLLFEENEWLKKGAVKAVALMTFFSLLTAVINLIPNMISFINSIVSAFGVNFISYLSIT